MSVFWIRMVIFMRNERVPELCTQPKIPPSIEISREQMLHDASQLLDAFSTDYHKMAE